MPRVLGISGSLRKASANSGLLRSAQAHAERIGCDFTIADIGSLPLYNQDLDSDHAPETVLQFQELVRSSDAVFFACPEYNYSFTAAMKNALDWASRPNLWKGKAAAVAGAGGGAGTVRAQLALRQSAVFLDMTFVNAPEVAIKRFEDKCFDDATGDLQPGHKWEERVGELVDRLVRLEGLLHPVTPGST
jgi:chromate reductase, NAD(P)H dehydrogenase (quinone)